MKTIKEILAFAKSEDPPPPVIPAVHEVALRLAAALLNSPKFAEDHAAAVSTAWALVPAYYQGEGLYRQLMTDMIQRQAMYEQALRDAETEGEMSPEEQHAYISGETPYVDRMTDGEWQAYQP